MSTQPTIRRLLPENMRVDPESDRLLRATKRLSYDRHTVEVAAADGAEDVQGGQEKVGHRPVRPTHRSEWKGRSPKPASTIPHTGPSGHPDCPRSAALVRPRRMHLATRLDGYPSPWMAEGSRWRRPNRPLGNRPRPRRLGALGRWLLPSSRHRPSEKVSFRSKTMRAHGRGKLGGGRRADGRVPALGPEEHARATGRSEAARPGSGLPSAGATGSRSRAGTGRGGSSDRGATYFVAP